VEGLIHFSRVEDAVSFDSRIAAVFFGIVSICSLSYQKFVMGRKLRRAGARPVSVAIHTAFGTQIALGIATVMSGVTIWIAVLHQLTGALLVVCTAWGAHRLGKQI
jgi:heme A synthase